MLEEGEPADAFLGWLGSNKIGKRRVRGALMLTEVMRREEILQALWPCFRQRGAAHEIVPRMLRWHQAMLKAGIDLKASGITARLRSWWHDSDEDTPSWGLLFQIVWDSVDEAERPTFIPRGRAWLERRVNDGSWPWVYQRLFIFSHAQEDFRTLGLRWLDCNLTHPYWPSVWGALFAKLENSGQPKREREELLRLALQAIPVQPETNADLAVWERTAKLDPPISEFLAAIVRKLAVVRSPDKVEKGVDFLLRFIASGELVKALSPSFRETMGGLAWSHIWVNLDRSAPKSRGS